MNKSATNKKIKPLYCTIAKYVTIDRITKLCGYNRHIRTSMNQTPGLIL